MAKYEALILKRLGGPQSGQIVDLIAEICVGLADVQARLNALIEAFNVAETADLDTSDAVIPTIER